MFALLSTAGTALYVKDKEILIQTVISRIFGITTESNAIGAIWFLFVLFETEVLDYIIHKIAHIWLVLVCGVLGSVFAIASIQLPFMLHLSFTAIVFFYIGKLLKRHYKNLMDCKGKGWIIVPVIIHIFATALNVKIDMYLFQYGNIVLFWIESIFGSIGILMIILWIGERYSWKCVDEIGKDSLIIMAVHSYIHMIACIIIDILTGTTLDSMLCSGIISVGWSGILVSLSYLCAKIIQRFLPVLVRPVLAKKRE